MMETAAAATEAETEEVGQMQGQKRGYAEAFRPATAMDAAMARIAIRLRHYGEPKQPGGHQESDTQVRLPPLRPGFWRAVASPAEKQVLAKVMLKLCKFKEGALRWIGDRICNAEMASAVEDRRFT